MSLGVGFANSVFGLFPLVFGTLKATFYTMIIAVPLALFAAIYTSEFLNPAWRMKIKPLIETITADDFAASGTLMGCIDESE